MLRIAPAWLVGSLSFVFLIVHTIFWCIPLFVGAVAKILLPFPAWRGFWTRFVTWAAQSWVSGNGRVTAATRDIEIDVRCSDELDVKGWYLVSCNHQSWTDIPVLQHALNGRVPFIRFFLKQELIWVPVLGLAWWALDFPFMKRYSREFLERHPEMRGQDLETTRKACERFRHIPVSILNFLEGTRFSKAKHAAQESPYRHLLKPKAGGIAFTIGTMGDKLHSMLDITIVYPEGRPSFWDYLAGRVHRVIVTIDEIPIPARFLGGSYLEDEGFREDFQRWTEELWLAKDENIERLLAQSASSARAAA